MMICASIWSKYLRKWFIQKLTLKQIYSQTSISKQTINIPNQQNKTKQTDKNLQDPFDFLIFDFDDVINYRVESFYIFIISLKHRSSNSCVPCNL